MSRQLEGPEKSKSRAERLSKQTTNDAVLHLSFLTLKRHAEKQSFPI